MKVNTAKTKLTLLSILAILAYCLLLLSSIVDGWDDFKLGFKEGFKDTPKKEFYFVDMKAKQGFASFPDSIANIKTGDKVNIRYDKAQLKATIVPIHGKSLFIYELIESLLALVIFFIGIYIPVLFFKLMSTLYLEVVFDEKNIRYIQKIGILLLLFYVVYFIFNYISYLVNISLFTFSNYTIQREPTDIVWILLGIVVLLFAEIVSKGSKIQEEQDLTI
jgi:hypothetical protein